MDLRERYKERGERDTGIEERRERQRKERRKENREAHIEEVKYR